MFYVDFCVEKDAFAYSNESNDEFFQKLRELLSEYK